MVFKISRIQNENEFTSIKVWCIHWKKRFDRNQKSRMNVCLTPVPNEKTANGLFIGGAFLKKDQVKLSIDVLIIIKNDCFLRVFGVWFRIRKRAVNSVLKK